MNSIAGEALPIVTELNIELKNLNLNHSFLTSEVENSQGSEPFHRLIRKKIDLFEGSIKERLEKEYFKYGPLDTLIEDEKITEIIINKSDSIWFELGGKLHLFDDCFLSSLTYEHFLQRLYLEIGVEPSLNNPFLDSYWKGHRIHVVGKYQQKKTETKVTIRKHRSSHWTLDELKQRNWCTKSESEILLSMIEKRKNFLVIGPTGVGKTSVLRALMSEVPVNDRILVIEDSLEIGEINLSGTHLITRYDSRGLLPDITLTDLVRQSLRMRPDRIVVGEVRGGEAKDLLMALATGHEGSSGTLHASSPNQALIRLEMLIQMGAPHWSLSAIRKLLSMSIDNIVVCKRNEDGHRQLDGIYKIIGTEENGLIIENIMPRPFY
jgi:pilus assembly protein CpaF